MSNGSRRRRKNKKKAVTKKKSPVKTTPVVTAEAPVATAPAGLQVDLDKIFCMMARKYGLEKLWLKAIAMQESSLNIRAYRYEQKFWDTYLAPNPEWNQRDPKEVSASYGIMQLLYTTAHMLGFRGRGEDLYNPVYNIELGSILLSKHLKAIKTTTNPRLHPMEIALAWYNGGKPNNPRPDGTLRNEEYVALVFKRYWKLRGKEEECA